METMKWTGQELILLDQTKLPRELCEIPCSNYQAVAEAVKTLSVRGAPAIGAAVAYGVVLAARQFAHLSREDFLVALGRAALELRNTRPTAVNLAWALDRLEKIWRADGRGNADTVTRLEAEAGRIFAEDVAANRQMGLVGQDLIKDGDRILTHCNAGALATAGYGTALGVVRAAREKGKEIHVCACETRPLLQGARLTTWELKADGIPATLITDNAAGYLMQQGKVNLVLVGADRITANGDVANKIGTYSLAVLAHAHRIPFYVAAPWSTVDLSLPDGGMIPIEERDADEVRFIRGVPIAPQDVDVYNPAFDVTPHRLVTAIITERGLVWPPFQDNLHRLAS